jgi:hypothetical protein
VSPEPAAATQVAIVPDEDRNWPRELVALRQRLGDGELTRRLEQPLSTDVDCGVPAPIWHLMAVLEWRRHGETAHPMAIRAAIIASHNHTRGHALTREAIAGVLNVVRGSH